MPIRFFSISARSPDANVQDDLNQFIAAHRIVTITKELVSEPEGAFWAIAVDYLPRGSAQAHPEKKRSNAKQVDFKEILEPADFALFAELREVRKQIATRESVPVYTIFTNQQLADIVTERVSSKASLAKVKGVGSSRVEKYGEEMLSCIHHFESPENEASQQSLPEDS